MLQMVYYEFVSTFTTRKFPQNKRISPTTFWYKKGKPYSLQEVTIFLSVCSHKIQKNTIINRKQDVECVMFNY